MKIIRFSGVFPVIGIALLLVSSAVAAPITVTNFSFEILPAGGLPESCGLGCSYSDDSIPGWSDAGGFLGQFQPGTHMGNTAYFSALSDGITSAFSEGSSISQTVGATVQAGVLYSLMVDIGNRNDAPPLGTAFLNINGVDYAAAGVFVPGGWGTFTATYLGTVTDAGSPITIRLDTGGVQGNFDNVRLSDDSTVVPEPTNLALIGASLIGLGWTVCRRSISGLWRR